MGGDGCLQQRQRPHDDREPDAGGDPQAPVGLRRRGDVGLARDQIDRELGAGGAGSGDAGTGWSVGGGAGRGGPCRRGRRGDDRREGAADPAPGRSGRSARRRPATSRSRYGADEIACGCPPCRHRGVRAGAQPARPAPSGSLATASGGRDRAKRGERPNPRRRQRDRVCALLGFAAAGPADGVAHGGRGSSLHRRDRVETDPGGGASVAAPARRRGARRAGAIARRRRSRAAERAPAGMCVPLARSRRPGARRKGRGEHAACAPPTPAPTPSGSREPGTTACRSTQRWCSTKCWSPGQAPTSSRR